jgi:hypothetical protein
VKVFISWSGAVSHQVALALRDWLPNVLQTVEPYVSSEDIDKGARWSTDISKELEDSSYGIICVTPDNIDAPWVNFEAGALSKSLERSRVAPFLFEVERTAVRGPLLQFQSTLVDREDLLKLVRSINKACEDHPLDEGRLDEIFGVWWPGLSERMEKIHRMGPTTDSPERPPDDVLAEVLELVRGQQTILANPEEILPPAYLSWAMTQVRWPDGGSWIEPDDPVWRILANRWRRLVEVVGEEREDVPAEIEKHVHATDRPIQHLTMLAMQTRRVRMAKRRPDDVAEDD